MSCLLYGALGAAMSKDPQAGERMLCVLIYMTCFILPVAPLILVGAKKRAYEAVVGLTWAKIAMAATTVSGVAGLLLIGTMFPMLSTTQPAFITATTSMVVGLLVMRSAERKYWADRHGYDGT